MSEPATAYTPLTSRMTEAGPGEHVVLEAGAVVTPDLATAAPDLTSTGVAVLAHVGDLAPGTVLTMVGERRMMHHLASAADVEIPVRLLSALPLTDEQADAILSRTMLAVLVAVS